MIFKQQPPGRLVRHPVAQASLGRAASTWSRWSAPPERSGPAGRGLVASGVRWVAGVRTSQSVGGPGAEPPAAGGSVLPLGPEALPAGGWPVRRGPRRYRGRALPFELRSPIDSGSHGRRCTDGYAGMPTTDLPGLAADTTFRVYNGDHLLMEVARTTTKPITRFKVRKPEPPRRSLPTP
jgi:hypothetical protein